MAWPRKPGATHSLVCPGLVGIHGVPSGTLLATNITVVLGHFHVLRLNVVEHMVFLRAPVLAHQADELRGGEPADVLLQLLPPAPPWGGRQVSQGSTWLRQRTTTL